MVNESDKTANFDRYLHGADAQGLNDGLEAARSACLGHWDGRHREYGDGGAYTPRGIIVAALHFGHRVTVRYGDAGQVRSAGPGLVWDFKGNDVEVVTPDNRPGSIWTVVDVDSIVSVEVFAEDGFDHMRSTIPANGD